MSSSLLGRMTPGRQFVPYFGPTSEENPYTAASPTSFELSEGHPKPSRPELVVRNPDPTAGGPGDSHDSRVGATSIRAVPGSGLSTSAIDEDFEKDETSGQYDRFPDRRPTSFSASDGGPPGDPSDSNEGGTGCLVDNSPWWQNQGPPDPPKPWYKRPIASFWKNDSALPSHLQPWWSRNKWIIALLFFLGTVMLVIGVLWASGTLTGANLFVPASKLYSRSLSS
jgi:hypothetical protein